MNEVITEPGPTRLAKVTLSASPGAVATSATSVMTFQSVQGKLTGKPLRAPVRAQFGQGAVRSESIAETAEIMADEQAMKAIAASAKQIGQGRVVPWSNLKRELGLG